MPDIHTKAKQIKTFLTVIGSGMFFAFALTALFLYSYNPEGSYILKNILLDPANAYSLHFFEGGMKNKESISLDGVEFSYFDQDRHRRKSEAISQEAYEKFYRIVEGDVSLPAATQEIENRYNTGQPAILSIRVKTTGRANTSGVDSRFTELVLAENGNDYRVRLRQHGDGSSWAYFQHPGIYNKAMELFASSP